ncbi:hypothetical protein [Vibrio vulnificus YJ016]|uniref:Uncharacterized protein n=1 Tax=Vibrio vulnificus (strain YJ016) TaxID=196600 RepID=Q7MC58_VIBVY|nr:hypothetical protein [Vibrio vulnificus YJ016]
MLHLLATVLASREEIATSTAQRWFGYQQGQNLSCDKSSDPHT